VTTTLIAPPIHRTSIGKKVIMAGSGLVVLVWLIGHMIGNLKAFLSPRELDAYAEYLRRMGEPVFPHTVLLWIIRVVLGVALVLHVYFAIDLSLQSRRARRHRYARTGHVQSNPAPFTMRWGGLAIGLFLIFHLANFTWGWIHPDYTYVRGAVYHNVVKTFDQWWLVVIYVAAMAALGLHLYHGTWSMFQTFGLNSQRWDRVIRRTAGTVAIVLFLGFIAVPIGVLAGVIS
jgi:succinate dehydrogenase / fumarate reductase cytochrome b subunit